MGLLQLLLYPIPFTRKTTLGSATTINSEEETTISVVGKTESVGEEEEENTEDEEDGSGE